MKGDYGEAIKVHKDAMKIDVQIGDQSSISKSLHALAMIEQIRGNIDEATKLYKQSLEIKEKLGD
jgi:tetratricopeptide (TPR) repeat protein